MLKTILKLSFFSGKEKGVDAHFRIKEGALEVSQRAKEMADAYEAQIDATKLAMVHLVGEFCVGITELRSMAAARTLVSNEVDRALKSGDSVFAKQKIAEQKNHERQLQQFLDSLNMLSPRIMDLRTRLGHLNNQKSNALMQAGALESRARFAETMMRVNRLVGHDSDKIHDMTESVQNFEAFTEAYSEVFTKKPEEDFGIAPSARTEIDDEYDRRLAELNLSKE
jgi:phage shock protein A